MCLDEKKIVLPEAQVLCMTCLREQGTCAPVRLLLCERFQDGGLADVGSYNTTRDGQGRVLRVATRVSPMKASLESSNESIQLLSSICLRSERELPDQVTADRVVKGLHSFDCRRVATAYVFPTETREDGA